MERIIDFIENIILNIFIFELNRSLSIIIFILSIILVRLLFKKFPKKYICILWVIAFARLIIPGEWTSSFSLNPIKEFHFFYDTREETEVISEQTEPGSTDSMIDREVITIPKAEENKELKDSGFGRTLYNLSYVWIFVFSGLICYSVVRIHGMKKKIMTATCVDQNIVSKVISVLCEKIYINKNSIAIYESDQIESPFLYGIMKPVIYLPLKTKESFQDMKFVIMHEQVHIARKDHIVKPILFLITCMYWFHPMVCIAFYLFSKDVEMAVDEAVCLHMEEDIRADYAETLLKLSIKQSGLYLPLAFGESNTKERIKHVLSWKIAGKWLTRAAVTTIIVMTICFGSGRIQANSQEYDSFPYYVEYHSENFDFKESQLTNLISNRNLYIGDASSTSRIVNDLLYTEDLFQSKKGIKMLTSSEPYELIILLEPEFNIEEDQWLQEKLFYANSILAFACIDNLSICTFQLAYEDHIISYSYRRGICIEDYVNLVYSGFYEYSESLDSMNDLVERMNDLMKQEGFQSGCEKTLVGTPYENVIY